MLTCRQIAEMATDRAEGALSWLDRLAFDRHLAGCDACRAYVRQLEVTAGTLRRIPKPDVSPALNEALMAQFDAWAAVRTASTANRVSAEGRARGRFALWPTLGAAAVLVLLVVFGRSRSQAPLDWTVGAALAGIAFVMASLAGRFAVGVVIAALLAAAAAALIAGRGGALDFGTGVVCLGLELGAAAVVGAAAWLGARRASQVAVRRSLAAGALAGAVVADAALQITCGSQDELPHLLAFHVSGILLVTAVALVVLRRMLGKRPPEMHSQPLS